MRQPYRITQGGHIMIVSCWDSRLNSYIESN
nr:MAG TPA: anhydrase [Caudoviricetes sp.]